ncbi:PREDICTED: uncharacterized protein LOC104591982 [Nelumbo nucifera]|nr:PREDICTED: uncharacterized protein LOC104591982 [Nelumbo nucifera]
MDNGIVRVTLSNPGGVVTGINYGGINNILEVRNRETNRGYWDVDWDEPGGRGQQYVIQATEFKVIVQNETRVEVSFSRKWEPSSGSGLVPLNIDKRFVMLRGSHGFYTYAIFEHLNGWPDFDLGVARTVFKLRGDKFHYMAISDSRQRHMPSQDDRSPQRAEPLAYKEAVRLTNPGEPEFRGQVDDKYQYSSNREDIRVHGWISFEPPVGFWVITPSNEFRTGGPLKQELTSHVGPTSLAVYISCHYMGTDILPMFRNGEPWKKVFGPIFIYLNSGPEGTKANSLWEDAKAQMRNEVQSWPYSFPASEDFPKSAQRGSVIGRLLVREMFINREDMPGSSAYVGLALPGEAGSWQKEGKGYQFWTKADSNGSFSIKNIRAGDYNLYAWVPGFIGEYKYPTVISVRPGGYVDLGTLVHEPPRDAPTLWEIGVPDRSAAEFFIPDPDSRYVNPLYINQDRFRQYGLWEKYGLMYPDKDLAYTVGVSDYRKDWFYAHVTRNNNGTYLPTTWTIHFRLENVVPGGIYKLRLAIASANFAEVQVRFNDMVVRPHFTTGRIGRDNSIARHAIHGFYSFYSVDVESNWLRQGDNTIYLRQARGSTTFQGVMYDYIRFEGPSRPS